MIKAVLFDMDGVLVDNDAYEEENAKYILKQAAAEQKISIQEAQKKMLAYIEAHKGKKEWHDWRLFSRHFGSEKLWVEAHLINLKHLKLVDGARELLENLHSKYTLVVASDAIQEVVDIKLGYFGVLHYFHHFFNQDSFKVIKNDVQYFNSILSELKLKPEEVVLVDDRLRGIKTARKLGIKTIKVPYEYKIHKVIISALDGENADADFVASNLLDVQRILENL